MYAALVAGTLWPLIELRSRILLVAYVVCNAREGAFMKVGLAGLALGILGALASTGTRAASLTLDETLALAEQANPALRTAQAQLEAAKGRVEDARSLLWNNPQLTAERTRRDVPPPAEFAGRDREWSAGVAQTFELAGQGGYRREAAESALTATAAEVEEIRRQVRAEVAQQFYRVLGLQQRILVESEAQALFERAATIVDRRRAAGEDSRLDANVAAVEAERARNQLAQAREQLGEVRTELAAKLQLPPDRDVEVAGVLDPAPLPYSLESLLKASETRPRVQSLAEKERAAQSRLSLERASVYPDVTVGLSVGREGSVEAREKLATLSLSLPLPLFKRNATGIGQASTELSQARIERQAAGRDVRAQVTALWQKLQSLSARVERLRGSVLPALDDNQRLSAKAHQTGEIGLLQLIVVNRQALDARRDALEALTDFQLTRIALELAAGWSAGRTAP